MRERAGSKPRGDSFPQPFWFFSVADSWAPPVSGSEPQRAEPSGGHREDGLGQSSSGLMSSILSVKPFPFSNSFSNPDLINSYLLNSFSSAHIFYMFLGQQNIRNILVHSFL